MRDDAIAPVIAVMLILAAIVTFLSLWNALYVPSMKESAEVDHLHNVETSFVHFSSDMDQAISSHQDNLVFSEPVQLGGGDTLVNELKSSGALQVQNESGWVYQLNFSDSSGTPLYFVNGTIVNYTYEPVNNFWQDQGYTWQYGYINVTKNGGTLSTPLTYYNMTNVQNEITSSGTPLNELASSLGSVGYIPYVYTNPTNQLPVVMGISPNFGEGSIDTPVNIYGSGFSGATNVNFDGIANGTANQYQLNVKNDGLIHVAVPLNTTAASENITINVTVSTPAGTSVTSSADQFTYNATPIQVPPYYPPWTGYCSSISLVAVNISASSKNFISSNGYGTLTLTTNATPVIFSQPITSIGISSDRSTFGNATLASWNKELADLANGPCSNSIFAETNNDPLNYTYTLDNQAAYPTNINLTVMQVTVGAH